MSSLIILLAQTKIIAILEILLMLTGAATIGYVTAWLFYRSVYNKKLKAVDAELDKSKSQVLKFNAELDKSKSQVLKLNAELDESESQVLKLNAELDESKSQVIKLNAENSNLNKK